MRVEPQSRGGRGPAVMESSAVAARLFSCFTEYELTAEASGRRRLPQRDLSSEVHFSKSSGGAAGSTATATALLKP